MSLLCFAIVTMHGVEPFGKSIIYEARNMACHGVVDMEANGVLLAVNHLVSDAGIVGIEHVSDGFKIGTELFVPEEDGLKHAIVSAGQLCNLQTELMHVSSRTAICG